MNYYLAVDIGASSGRHILGYIEDGHLRLLEVHRFQNGMIRKNGHLCWDIPALFTEIMTGLKKCRELGTIPVSMGIDTWAVDYVLLDEANQILGDTYGYRDGRTTGMDEKVSEILPPDALYQRTGIQKQIFNTIYQLMSVREHTPELLAKAKKLLMLPDYLHYLLTGVSKTEYTNATSTQLVSPLTRSWDLELIKELGFPEEIFGEISMPGTIVGPLTAAIAKEVGFNCQVILPATHDTASAVMAVPAARQDKDILYISSGTWSLMGTELMEVNASAASRQANMTNEGGYEWRYRYLKNIMGLWMIQEVRKELKDDISFARLCDLAQEETIGALVNCRDDRFLAPASMIAEIQAACKEGGFPVPSTSGELAAVVYNSLAACYGATVKEIEALTNKQFNQIHIVGGGANADYLNRLTAKATGKTVYAGPTEATAIGNILAQMIQDGVYHDLAKAREAVLKSFDIKKYDWRNLDENE